MKEMKLTEIIGQNQALGRSLSKKLEYKLAVLSNIMVPQVREIMELMLRREEINAVVEFGDYDNIVQDSTKFTGHNAILIFWELANLVDGLQYKIELMDKGEVDLLTEKIISEIDLTLSNLGKTSLVLMNRFSTLLFNSTQIRKNNFDYIAEQLNSYLDENNASNMIIIDIDKIIADVSVLKCADWRFYYSSKSLYTVEFFKAYAKFVRPIFMSACGKAKKALIFDCDNTLWKGILGEDGHDGIKMSALMPEGVVYEEVQSIAVKLAKQGVIIGICSKNNASDVDEVINNHSDIKLSDKHIVIKKVNWQSKLDNLISMAHELNVSLESFVFIDDSAFEINHIRAELPLVTTIQVPKTTYLYPSIIRDNSNLFFSLAHTSEDIQKATMYKEDALRREVKVRFGNIEEYLSSLELKVTIFENNEELFPRTAQLTQKTNQFNLTTKRYVESEIRAHIMNSAGIHFAFSVVDKFGDCGVVGVIIVNVVGVVAEFDSFLMSCRVIGRNVEYTVTDWVIARLKEKGIKEVRAKYRRTQKNEQVSTFYDSLGFAQASSDSEGKYYVLEVEKYLAKNINYIEVKNG
ncbi:MAG: HAD-IIIC family phosphatase [Methylococcaceae bacterium]